MPHTAAERGDFQIEEMIENIKRAVDCAITVFEVDTVSGNKRYLAHMLTLFQVEDLIFVKMR